MFGKIQELVDSWKLLTSRYLVGVVRSEISLAFATILMATNIWLARAGETSPPKQITNRVNGYLRISWTPSGGLVYASDKSGGWEIWIRDPVDGNERQLTVNSSGNILPSVSPDGRYVFFTSFRTDNTNIWRMDIDGANPKQITNGNRDYSSSCSPDGKWLVYVQETSGKSTLWKVSTDGGTPIQLTERANRLLSSAPKRLLPSHGHAMVSNSPSYEVSKRAMLFC